MNSNAAAEKGGRDICIEMLRSQRKRADTSSDRPGRQCIEMLHGQRKRADTTSDRPKRQMNRNATWPAAKGGLHGHWKRADTSSDRPGRQMHRNATWPKKE